MTNSTPVAILTTICIMPVVCMALLQIPNPFNFRALKHGTGACYGLHALSPQQQKQGRIPNEFSRVYATESILNTNNREYRIDVSATADELQALSKRFSLPEIRLLSASLSIRKHSSAAGRGTTAAQGLAMEVQGKVESQLKQTCVRTGQPFDVELTFPLLAVVRPIVSLSSLAAPYDDMSVDQDLSKGDSRNRQKQRKAPKQQRQQQPQPRSIDEVNLTELQRMLQDIDLSDDVFEDDAIYDAASKQLDVGELVAQYFCLQLDPYPKKPGTSPVQISISG